MIHIIPAWKSIDIKPQFDESIYEAKLFLRNRQKVNLVFPEYLPRLREQLKFNQLENIDYFSTFDKLQLAENQRILKNIKYDDFTWPAGSEFVFSNNEIKVFVNSKLFANLALSKINPNTISHVNFFDDNSRINKIIDIDDRGFISRISEINNNQIIKYYLNVLGKIVAREELNNEHESSFRVLDSGNLNLPIINRNFSDISEFKEYVLKNFFARFNKQDKLIMSLSKETKTYLKNIDFPKFSILTSNAWRKDNIQNTHTFNNSYSVVTNSILDTNYSATLIPTYPINELVETKYSNSLFNIFWSVNNLRLTDQMIILKLLITNMRHMAHDKWHLVISGGSQLTSSIPNDLKHRIKILTQDEDNNETTLMQLMQHANLLIDFSPEANIFLQTLALQMCIPQINHRNSSYMINQHNGIVVNNYDELTNAINHYFNNFDARAVAANNARLLADNFSDDIIFNLWRPLLTQE